MPSRRLMPRDSSLAMSHRSLHRVGLAVGCSVRRTRAARGSAPRCASSSGCFAMSTPNRRADASCGTRQQSAIVGASPTQNVPAVLGRERAANAARPSAMNGCGHAASSPPSALTALRRRQVLQRLDAGVDDLGELRGRARAGSGSLRQERRLGQALVEVLEDRQRLRDRVHACRRPR